MPATTPPPRTPPRRGAPPTRTERVSGEGDRPRARARGDFPDENGRTRSRAAKALLLATMRRVTIDRDWTTEGDTCIALLRDLIRVPSVNRGTRDEGDGNERPA